jgi:hypothetical protein
MKHATRALRIAGLVAILGSLGLRPALAGDVVALTIRDGGAAVVDTRVELFLSNDHLVGQTDADGVVTFEIESGKGFWVEVRGERLAEYFLVEQAPFQIDLAEMDTIEWERR